MSRCPQKPLVSFLRLAQGATAQRPTSPSLSAEGSGPRSGAWQAGAASWPTSSHPDKASPIDPLLFVWGEGFEETPLNSRSDNVHGISPTALAVTNTEPHLSRAPGFFAPFWPCLA